MRGIKSLHLSYRGLKSKPMVSASILTYSSKFSRDISPISPDNLAENQLQNVSERAFNLMLTSWAKIEALVLGPKNYLIYSVIIQ